MKHLVLPMLILMLVCAAPMLADEAIPPVLIHPPTQTLAGDLVLSARQVQDRMKANASFLMVDVRDKDAFDALHIPGAVHSPLHFLKTRPYLRSTPIILIDKGLSCHRLAPVCRELKSMGADVRLLVGGMNAWVGIGGPVTGDLTRQIDYARISPADFFHEKTISGVTVCDVSATRSDLSKKWLPDAVHLPVTKEPELKAFLKSHGKDAAVILVSNTESDEIHAAHILKQAGFTTVFVLDGGVPGYADYLTGLSLSWQPKDSRTVQVNPCRDCGPSLEDENDAAPSK